MKLRRIQYNQLDPEALRALYQRPQMESEALAAKVRSIISDVRDHGDEAVLKLTRRFDSTEVHDLLLEPNEVSIQLDPKVQQAIDIAYDNILRFHRAQRPHPIKVETMPGVECRRVNRPIQRVGLYVPGGTAVLPSTALMLGVPAQIAECSTIIFATPPRKDGSIAPEIIYIAQKVGARYILKAGGAQAMAAMAYGTSTIPKVDKLFGPGNQYVTEAKMQLQNSDAMVSIDMPAGPSEVLVMADQQADPDFVAADLLSQAEHGADSQVVLVVTPNVDLDAIDAAIKEQLSDLPRADYAQQSLANGYALIVDNWSDGMRFSNNYAPEHLIINTQEAEQLADQVQNAGSVFIGQWTPESVGDYASGTNHTLPTFGYARMYSGVSLASFMKSVTMQRITQEGLQNIGSTVETLAERESLDAHKRAVSIRLQKLNATNQGD
ncbi:MAG: histidinol dehydrogenase [Bacteroidota bacterium]